MAAETLFAPNFAAKDWETIIGIVDNSAENDLRKMKLDLAVHYAANGNPSQNTVVNVQIKEKTLVKIFQNFYGNTVRNIYNDVGASPFKRIIDAIRAKAAATLAAGDNYLTTQLTQEDTARDAQQTSIRKNGRQVLMMEGFDNA